MIHMNKGDSQENIAKILIPKLNASDAKQRYDVLQIHNIEADLFLFWSERTENNVHSTMRQSIA